MGAQKCAEREEGETVAIIGSRTFKDYDFMNDRLKRMNIKTIVSGGAKGADSLARTYALKNSIPLIECKPNYKKNGRGAPQVRNKEIVDVAEGVIAFWYGESSGTKHTLEWAERRGKRVEVVGF